MLGTNSSIVSLRIFLEDHWEAELQLMMLICDKCLLQDCPEWLAFLLRCCHIPVKFAFCFSGQCSIPLCINYFGLCCDQASDQMGLEELISVYTQKGYSVS